MKDPISLIFELWIYVARSLVLWLVIALFIPGIVWYDHTYVLLTNLIAVPAGFIFNFFNEYSQTVLDTWGADTNPIEDGVNLMLFIGSIGLALALPVLYFAGWFFSTVLCFGGGSKYIVQILGGGMSAEAENNWHLLSGRMTIDESFEYDQKANAIAAALKKHQ